MANLLALLAALGRRFPRSSAVVRMICGILVCGFVSVAIFSREAYAIVLSLAGAAASLETFAAVGRGQRDALKVFGVAQLLISGLSILLSVLNLARVEQDCAKAYYPGVCTNLAVVLSVVLAAGSSTLGVFAALAALLAYLGWRSEEDDGQAPAAGTADAKLTGDAVAAGNAGGAVAPGAPLQPRDVARGGDLRPVLPPRLQRVVATGKLGT